MTKSGTILTGIHVNDFFIGASQSGEATKFQNSSLWKISDLGEAKFCVGIAIECDFATHHIFLSQTVLINKLLPPSE